MAGAEAKKSDLPARVGSALVMVAVAGTALWLGGLVWTAFVLAVAAGVLWEWVKLANAITPKFWARVLWLVGGVLYIGVAAGVLSELRRQSIVMVLLLLGAVVAVDIGAYFTGRAIGGPKIAPKISPSKTWAGLAGGIIGAAALFVAYSYAERGNVDCYSGQWDCASNTALVVNGMVSGLIVAVLAQSGDFFESWMKRTAGVKDSGSMLPGHGGLFDRADGMLAVAFMIGAIRMALHT